MFFKNFIVSVFFLTLGVLNIYATDTNQEMVGQEGYKEERVFLSPRPIQSIEEKDSEQEGVSQSGAHLFERVAHIEVLPEDMLKHDYLRWHALRQKVDKNIESYKKNLLEKYSLQGQWYELCNYIIPPSIHGYELVDHEENHNMRLKNMRVRLHQKFSEVERDLGLIKEDMQAMIILYKLPHPDWEEFSKK